MRPASKLPSFTLGLAVTSLILLPVAALGSRLQFFHFRIGLLLFTLAALLGLIAIAISALRTRRQASEEGRRTLSRAAMLALPAVMFFTLNLFAGAGAPLIHDISTDTVDPPQFEAALEQRSTGDNQPEYNADIAAQQRSAYPEIQTIHSQLPPAQAIARARAIAEDMGWEVYAYDAQRGHLEAVASTRWFGFRDDVVVRVRASETGSSVDLRSASRVGEGDLGANARRIRDFSQRFQSAEVITK